MSFSKVFGVIPIAAFLLLLTAQTSLNQDHGASNSNDSLLVRRMDSIRDKEEDSIALMAIKTTAARIGIPIPEQEFDSLVYAMTDRMKSPDVLLDDECVVILRIYNTMRMGGLSSDLYDRFYDKCSDILRGVIFKKLDVSDRYWGRGGGLCSSKYSICFGGAIDSINKFKIVH